LDGRADQYALGLVFFQLLARRAPYDDMGDGAMMAAIIHPRTPPDIRAFRPEVDAETAEVLMRMLQDDPSQRFQSTAELVKALAKVQAPIEARSSSLNDFARTPTEREATRSAPARTASARPAMIVLIAAALTLSLLAAGIYLWRTKSPVAPAVATAPSSTTAAVDPLRQEAWAKYLLSRYRLETVAEKNDWTLDLVAQAAGVIDAELYDPDDSLIELSGRVESHQIETIDGEEWETYQLKLLGPGDIVMDMRVSFSDESTTGKASLLYYGEKQHFEIKESVDL
jgi:serine/threonine protein kinase